MFKGPRKEPAPKKREPIADRAAKVVATVPKMKGKFTAADLATAAGVSRFIAQGVVRKLIKEGKLVAKGDHRGRTLERKEA